MKSTRTVRALVFEREQDLCRCCRLRKAESLHELVPRSLGGVVSLENSVALCGNGTQQCHGYLQRHEIVVQRAAEGAEATLWFTPATWGAAEWMQVPRGWAVERPAQFSVEAA